MFIKTTVRLFTRGSLLKKGFYIEVATKSRPNKPIYSQQISDDGKVNLNFQISARIKELVFTAVSLETKEVVHRSLPISIDKIEKQYDISIDGVQPSTGGEIKIFTIAVQNTKMEPLVGLFVQLRAQESGGRILFAGTTVAKGYLRVKLEIPKNVAGLFVEVLTKKNGEMVGTDGPRKSAEISKWWAVEVDVKSLEVDSETDIPPQPPVIDHPVDENGKPIEVKDAPKLSPADKLRQRLDRKKLLRDSIREASRDEINRRKKRRRKGRDFGRAVLGKKPVGKLGRPDKFVEAGEDPRPMQKEIVSIFERDLGKLAPKLPGIRLPENLPEGFKPGRPIDPNVLNSRLPSGPNTTFEHRFWKEILKDCGSKAFAERLEEDAFSDEKDVEEVVSTIISTEASDTEISMQERVNRILDAALGTNDKRPTAADITQSLEIELPSGPADADAYYDYHTINVAWFDAWTAVIDVKYADKIAELYDTIVDVVDPEDVDADLSEIDELHDMLNSLADSVAAASATIGATASVAPEAISSWIPEIGKVWNFLTDTERDYVEVQKEIQDYLVTSEAFGKPTRFLDSEKVKHFYGLPTGWVEHKWVSAAQADLVTKPKRYKDRCLATVDLERARDKKTTAQEEEDLPTYDTNAASRLGRAERLIGELKSEIVAPYQFDVFAPGSYNFGTLTTWRQRWRPLGYQVGDLAGSIPLAPNEKRSYSITRKKTSKSTTSRDRDRMSSRLEDRTQNRRAEADITGKVQRTMNAGGSVNGGVDTGIYNVGVTSNFSAGQTNDSARAKKDIRDLTIKAVQEYRDEHKLNVTTETTLESTWTESREISNPNNELTVTYLFYELQRRHEVTERLHHLQPIVLVAFEMPQPSEITEAWLLKYDWLIQENLLDATFLPALTYLRGTFSGDEVSVEILEQQWKTQLMIVTDLRHQGAAHQELRNAARTAVKNAVLASGISDAGEEFHSGGIGRNLGERIYAAEGEITDSIAENARSSLDWAEQDLGRVEATAREAMTALERATEVYVEAVEKRLNRRTQIDRLILHVKENILHYMQVIWLNEHPDQRYLRLYDMDIQWPGQTAAVVDAAITQAPAPNMSILSGIRFPAGMKPRFQSPSQVVRLSQPEFKETRKLHEVANLQRIIGFRGNLAIFELNEHNALSTFMGQEFLDTHYGLNDPDPLSFMPTATEAVEIADCAWKNPGLTEKGRKEITNWLMDTLSSAHLISQEVTTPTGELFIEALPGAHPLLEDFKLKHRAFDAAKAAITVRQSQLELLRYAMRLNNGETGDPELDKHIEITGANQVDVNLTETD